LVAVAQVTPGPVALNAATLVGWRLYGLPGAIAATLSVVAVPLAAAVAISLLSKKALKSGGKLTEALKTGTLGLLAMTLWAFMPQAAASWRTAGLSLLAFGVSAFTKVNPLWVILGSGFLGMIARLVWG
ncbi:MAG TPA: chromate transporter, partial [Spirochaetales bacterium]|nr:chromate transporter [Spirochaetales bacterium]